MQVEEENRAKSETKTIEKRMDGFKEVCRGILEILEDCRRVRGGGAVAGGGTPAP